MAITADEVRVAGAGHVYVAPAGTALPIDLEALPADWIDLGYVTEDGVGFSFNRETEDINAWQGSKLRVVTTNDPASVTFALMQTNVDVLEVAFGGGSFVDAGGVGTFTPPPKGYNEERACVIEFNDGDINYRYCLSRIQLEGEVTFTLVRSGALTYPLTMGLLDADPKFTIITDDPNLVTTSPPLAARKAAPASE